MKYRKVWLVGLLGLLVACSSNPVTEPDFDPDDLACQPQE